MAIGDRSDACKTDDIKIFLFFKCNQMHRVNSVDIFPSKIYGWNMEDYWFECDVKF